MKAENNLEVERKYLLDALPFDVSGFGKEEITQGYISVDPVLRLRRTGVGSAPASFTPTSFTITMKGSGSLARTEYELPLTEEQFNSLWKKVETGRIEKTRYKIPLETGHTAELDVYKNELHGLLTVEVEFASESEAVRFTPPAWFGRDVTFESRYKNSSLSVYGL